MPIRRATTADIGRLGVTAMRAFVDDPVMRWLYPDDETFLAPGGAVFWSAMRDWVRHGELWCTDDAAAIAVWLKPGRPELPPDPDADATASDATAAAEPAPAPELLRRFELVGAAMSARTPPEDHWYLQLLATHPDWQRQGLGAALMAVQFANADEQGLPCYLETETPENVAYYRRFGFDVTGEWDIDPDATLGAPGPHMWGMYRAAR